jgi:hypothetical protein
MTRYEIALGKRPPPQDPANFYQSALLGNADDMLKKMFINYAEGEALDVLGLNVGITRKQGYPDESDFEYRDRITRYIQGR